MNKAEPMEEDSMSSTEFEPLFIKEEDANPNRKLTEQRECNMAQPGLSFTDTPALIKPYLQEMDELLKNCEQLTGIPFGSHFSASYKETSLSASTHSSKEKDTMESVSPQAYLSTTYIDTHMDGAETDEEPQGSGGVVKRCGVSTEASPRTEMPVTSAGNKLSESMVEYEDQLLGMLAMLESCMEESGMDFEPQGWANQEYVHISNSHRSTTLGPVEQDRSGQHAGGDGVFKENRCDKTVGGCEQNPLGSCDNMAGFSMETWQDQTISNDPMCCEAAKTDEDIHMTGDSKEERQALKMDSTYLGSGMSELGTLGSRMEECIEEVQLLEKKRRELLMEVLKLRGSKDGGEAEGSNEEEEEQINSKVVELMNILKREEEERREERKKEIQSLREERAQEERMLWKVNLERQGLHEELRKMKRKLFAMARDCAHNQAALNTQHREVELLKREEEKLQTLVLQLMEESSQIRAAQQQQLLHLQAELHARSSSQTSNTQDELTECRRHSCGDIQQYLQGGLKALEDRYEPILLTLLKRREATAGGLVKAKEQAQELRAQLRPLKDEIQKLNLQKACLEEKLKLLHIQRREDLGQYKETVFYLEDRSRELKAELMIQKRQTKEVKELRDSLSKQLHLYRAAIEDHNQSVSEEKT